MDNQTISDVISLVASIASLILAIGAIWLSVVFYRMSSEASRVTTEAAKGIGAVVERLEKLFDKLYSDTFSMMRDTVSDMRKHIWPAEATEQEKPVEEAEKKADEKINALKASTEAKISEILQRQRIAEDKMTTIRDEMGPLLEKAIIISRQADSEAREETLRDNIVRAVRKLMRQKHPVTVDDLIGRLSDQFAPRRIVMEIEQMIREGLLVASGPLGPGTSIRLATMEEG